jgi:diguanylate cyclase
MDERLLRVYDVQEYFTKIAPIVYPLSLALSCFFVIIVRDLQLDFMRRASLIEEASRDHLTKLYNVRTFERYYNTLMEQMNQDRSQQIRWNDFVARYGGEEFIVVLPDGSKGIA